MTNGKEMTNQVKNIACRQNISHSAVQSFTYSENIYETGDTILFANTQTKNALKKRNYVYMTCVSVFGSAN